MFRDSLLSDGRYSSRMTHVANPFNKRPSTRKKRELKSYVTNSHFNDRPRFLKTSTMTMILHLLLRYLNGDDIYVVDLSKVEGPLS